MITERILSHVVRLMLNRSFQPQTAAGDSLPPPAAGRVYMLYAHVPFCKTLCPYCSFNRFIFDETTARTYFRFLREELRMLADAGYVFKSVYFGGGTPTVLVDELIETIVLVKDLFGVQEVSCETNPDHLVPHICGRLEGLVQRLSVGVQSFDNALLTQMCRLQKYGTGEQILERIRRFADTFETLNIDMIFNFPSQTEAVLRQDIQRVIASGANQVSFYPLMTAPSVEQNMLKTIGKLDPSREERFYRIITEDLSPYFNPTTAWTFSRRNADMIDEYIAEFEEYAAAGSGSFSYLDGAIYVNTFSLREYQQRIESGKMSVSLMQRFSKADRMRYRFMMELFSLRLDKQRFRRDFGVPVELGLWKEMTYLTLAGAFARNDDKEILLTPKGRYLVLAMMREFFSLMDTVRERARSLLPEDEKRLISTEPGKPILTR